MFRTKISFADAMSILFVLILAAVLFWQPWASKESGNFVVVSTPDGQHEYSLSEEREVVLTSNGTTLKIMIADGYAKVLESDCPDQLCVSIGSVSKDGETIVCAPAGISITVKGDEGNVDFIAG